MFTLLGIPRGKVSSCSETSNSTGQVSSGVGSNSAGVLLSSGQQLTQHSTATVCPAGTVRLFIYHSSKTQVFFNLTLHKLHHFTNTLHIHIHLSKTHNVNNCSLAPSLSTIPDHLFYNIITNNWVLYLVPCNQHWYSSRRMPGHIREFNTLKPHSSHDLVFKIWRNNKTEATLRVFCLCL